MATNPTPPNQEETEHSAPPSDLAKQASAILSKAENWIKGIEFGIFILAAIGIFYYAIKIQRQATIESLIPYCIAVIAIGALLFILDYGRRQAAHSPNMTWIGHILTAALSVVLLIILIWFGTFAFRQAGILPPTGSITPEIPVPDKLPIKVCQTHRDPTLTADLFGPPNDEIAKARLWMSLLERGAEQKLKTANPRHLWILSDPLKHHPRFTIQVDVNTASKMVVLGYLIRLNPVPSFTPLHQVKGTGTASQYAMEVPETDDGDTIAIFLSMDDEDYNSIAAEPKFSITTRTASGNH